MNVDTSKYENIHQIFDLHSKTYFLCRPCLKYEYILVVALFSPVLSNPLKKRESSLRTSQQRHTRWSDDMFGKGCRCAFHIHCHSDEGCRHHAVGSQEVYRCVYSCCGTKCVHHHIHTSKEVGAPV